MNMREYFRDVNEAFTEVVSPLIFWADFYQIYRISNYRIKSFKIVYKVNQTSRSVYISR